MLKKDYGKLYGEYRLFLRYATRFNCFYPEELSEAEKSMYSDYIINMFKNMPMDELIYICSEYTVFNENLNKLVDNYRKGRDSSLCEQYNDVYRKYYRKPLLLIPEEDRKKVENSQLYNANRISDVLQLSRYVSSLEIESVVRFVNGMKDELDKAIDNRIHLITDEQIELLKGKYDELMADAMKIVAQVGSMEAALVPSYVEDSNRINVYKKYLKQVNEYFDDGPHIR